MGNELIEGGTLVGERLAGRIACISGIGRGQGRAAAILFASEGAVVVGCDVNEAEGNRTAEDIRADGGRIEFTVANAFNEEDVARWIDVAITRHGGVDVLYNNAAFSQFTLVHEMGLSDWQTAIHGELDVVFLGCKYALPHLMERGRGAIVNTASVSGLLSTELPGLTGGMAHAAGKAGVMGFTRSLAQEYARHGIRANAVCPGAIETPSNVLLDDPTFMAELLRRVPLGRIGTPQDIAYAALYLASDEAAYVTGQTLTVDGGWSVF